LLKFSYQRKTFGTYEFGALGPEGPWSLFDKLGSVIMLSPADNFLVSRMNESPEGTAASGIDRAIQTLPAGFSHSTLLVFDRGMNQAFSDWGSALLALGGKRRPANDANVVLDPVFWKSTSQYLADAGVVTYQRDWLDHNTAAELNLTNPRSFLGNMSEAMLSKGITVQHCMPLPSHYMASRQYSNVPTIRTSLDRFDREKWDSFLYDSRLATAVGLWPWTDVFFSNELPNLILSTLSAGPVGVGDAWGEANAHNLAAAVRTDGLIVKADSPLLPINLMYASDALNERAPMVAMSENAFGNQRASRVFAHPRSASQESVAVPLSSLEMTEPVFAYDWVTHNGGVIPDRGSLRMNFTDGSDYQTLSPVNRQGLALLGDTEKIVSLGKQRFAAIDDHGTLRVTIKFARGEDTLTISGYASHRPKFKALQGKLNDTSYDPQTKIFRAQTAPAGSGEAILQVIRR
jgi:hypothetical protein